MRGWRLALGITVGLFAAGVAVGYVANKRGVPKDQVGRWLLKESTRAVLRGMDAVRELVPDGRGVPLTDALTERA